jgi:WD40 repeat protein
LVLAVSASRDKTLKVWDLSSGQEIRTLKGHTEQVSDVAVMPDGRLAVSVSRNGDLHVWNLSTREAIISLKTHASLQGCAFTLGTTLLAWDNQGGVHFLDWV